MMGNAGGRISLLVRSYRKGMIPSNGQILAILALIVAALLSVATLGVDVFHIYWNKNRLQGGTDATALAGAVYAANVQFQGNDPRCTYGTDAQNAACSYALTNGVALNEIVSILFDPASRKVTVSTTRSVPALFAKLVGYSQFTVTAIASAMLQALGSGDSILPIGLDSKTPYTYGQPIVMHVGGCGPGCWQGLALQSYGGGSTGGSVFQQNLTLGCDCTVAIGDTATSEPGAKTGPTKKGITDRNEGGERISFSGGYDRLAGPA
jgi:Putative Flp pilus-assembly TadE/G-like